MLRQRDPIELGDKCPSCKKGKLAEAPKKDKDRIRRKFGKKANKKIPDGMILKCGNCKKTLISKDKYHKFLGLAA